MFKPILGNLFLLFVAGLSSCFSQEVLSKENKKLNIKQELSYSLKVSSDPQTKEMKMPNGKISTFQNKGGLSQTDYSRFTDFSITSKTGKWTFQSNITRIKYKNSVFGTEIDTATPFASDKMTKGTLDYYLQDLGKTPKVEIDQDNFISPNKEDATFWNGPIFHPIHEFSGILLNLPKEELKVGYKWQDSIPCISNAYKTIYQVTKIVDEIATVEYAGFLIKISSDKISSDETFDIQSAVSSGKRIEPKVVLKSAMYGGKLNVDLNTQIIRDLNISMSSDQSSSRLGFVTENTVTLEGRITNIVER